MKIVSANSLLVDNKDSLDRLYRGFADPKLTTYTINVTEEAPKVAQQIATLSADERKQVEQHVIKAVKGIDPVVWKKMGVGAAAGGLVGGGFGLAAISFRQISANLGNPLLLLIATTAMGVAAGAVTPAIFESFPNVNVDSEAKSPGWWNIFLPTVNVKVKATTGAEPKAPEK